MSAFVTTPWEAKTLTIAASTKGTIALGDNVSELVITSSAAVTVANEDGGTAFQIPATTPVNIGDAHTWSNTTMHFVGVENDVVTVLVTYGTKRGGR